MAKKNEDDGLSEERLKSFLSDRLTSAFKKIDHSLDQEVEEVVRRTDTALRVKLESEGLLPSKTTIKKPKPGGAAVRAISYLRGFFDLFLQAPAIGIAAVAVVALAAALVFQQKRILDVENELAVAKKTMETQISEDETSEVYAELEAAFHSKLYIEKNSVILSEAATLAKKANVELRVITVGEGGAVIGGLELRKGQQLIVTGPLSAKLKSQRALKELLELPDDTEGMAAVAVVEY